MNKEQLLHWCQTYAAAPPFQKPLIMGVLNVTPDSFSDAGKYNSIEKACARALAMIEQGADIIDIGGESTKPSATKVSLDEELSRVIPVLEQLTQRTDICISIDTYKPEVMQAAVSHGAGMINDIYALRQPNALAIAANLSVPICLMHMQGTPDSMQCDPQYPEGIISDIHNFFKQRLQACTDAGIQKTNLILDPGFGFGKSLHNNMQMVANIDAWQDFRLPVLLGVSRKSTIGAILNKPINERLIGGLTIAIYTALNGVGIIRTHDIDETKQALLVMDYIRGQYD